ncbi:adenylyl-sulfate kinase [Actinobacteria bacterium YIM 96077]|uniref:Adenylyl-sulfate kinase n=2 Tax=Phytoactinopolyspora halophila TaxID=1981511 RepID=A0A329QIH1_9ACTN|nr:adenylyl-sulfate kinase [Actinobacteria bacterium YIM 96077]RAW11489.1 adenylyl-sulfate kinase [Phytoactinopolyspora halophila]
MSIDIPAGIGERVEQSGRLVLTDPEGAPVAELADIQPARPPVPADGSTGEFAVTGRVVRTGIPASTTDSDGPYSWLRLPPSGQFEGASAVVSHDPIDAYALQAADPHGPLLLVVLDGPRARPGPDAPTVARATLALRDQLREQGRHADAVLVPAPQYGDERDEHLAETIARAYGARLVRPARRPDLAALFAGLDGRAVPPVDEWPEPSLHAWQRWRPPRRDRGLVVFFTGLSGSGKSTVARAVTDHLAEDGRRRVTLLDGDVVRRNLSAGLGFSRADRDRNIERIGYVAAEIARHGGTAVCAPIAPFAATRARVRQMVEAHADFLLIYVATPLAECERRDRKGLYARARAGEIADFTGISSPYEAPEDAELVVDTSDLTIEQARDAVIGLLTNGGWLD